MRSTTLIRITVFGLFAGLAVQAETKDQDKHRQKGEKAPRYEVRDLGTLGGTYSFAFGMNDLGEVAGGAAAESQVGGLAQTAFLWSRGQMLNLGTLGGLNSAASGVNARGEVAIGSETASPDPANEDFCAFGTHAQCSAAIWTNGTLKPLSSLPGGSNAVAINVNNRGQVIGFSENGVPDPACLAGGTPFQIYQFEAVIWNRNGTPRELHSLPGDTVGFALGINERGQVVGTSGLCSETALPPAPTGRHAVLWERDGTPVSLPGLGGDGFNIAASINDRGEVTGTSQSPVDGTVHAVFWTRDRELRDLGAFPGAFLTVPPCCNTLNNRGEVVGFALDPDGTSRALVWVDDVPVDLNTLIPKDSGWYLQAAESLNDAGQISGYGLIHGETHAFLATPIRHEGRHDR